MDMDNKTIIIEFSPNSFTASIPRLYHIRYLDEGKWNSMYIDGRTLELIINMYGYETNNKELLSSSCGTNPKIKENISL
jgi:hypothetical protein